MIRRPPTSPLFPYTPLSRSAPHPPQFFLKRVVLKDPPVQSEQPVQFSAVRVCQILPATQQQPFLPFDESPLLGPLPEELRPPHLIDGIVGVLQHVKLVVYDLALGRPLLNAQPEWLPHVHTHRLAPFPLAADRLATKEIAQGLLLPFLTAPHPLAPCT